MKINYIAKDDKRDEQFIALFSLGIVSALKENLIACDDACNWLLNIRTLEMLKEGNFSKDIVNAIHLGTELENVKRIIPEAFLSSCDEILEILKGLLKQDSFDNDVIDYLIEVKN